MQARLHWISDCGDSAAFPPVSNALTEPSGLLAAGGDLRPRRLLAAYAQGIFPWYEEGQPILWWSPDPRAVLFPDDLHVPRRLARTLRNSALTFSADTAFDAVIRNCAAPRPKALGTWITRDMIEAYGDLHRIGWAHAFEGWSGDDLVAGMYGVAIGRVFFGESMFTRLDDASKAVFVRAVEYLRARSFELIDSQVWSGHLQSLGATTLPRPEFVARLKTLCALPGEPGHWKHDYARHSQTRELQVCP